VETKALLEVKRISVDYEADNGTVHAVTDVSFTLRRGQILGIAGESGSGKSTLAYAIARLLRPPALVTQGSVIYYPPERSEAQAPSRRGEKHLRPNSPAGVDILRMPEEQLRVLRWAELAMVFQSAMNALNPVMTIGKQIMDVLRMHRPSMGSESRKQRAFELLRLVGIAPDRLRSYPHELSGGMRQRAIIAIALALNPEIIILDEPTTALDVVVQREILTEIMRLRKQLGFSVIFITHDLSLLLEMADSVAIMYAGRLVEMAGRRELYTHALHPYSYGLLHSFPSLDGPRRRMTGIPGSPPDLRNAPTGCAFHPRCPVAFAPCSQALPLLQASGSESNTTASGEAGSHIVACHLYNPTYRAIAPGETAEASPLAEIANAYAALAEAPSPLQGKQQENRHLLHADSRTIS